MSDQKKIIVYHAYGLKYLYNQVRFSILTLYHHLEGNFENVEIVIYTDRPKKFSYYKKEMPLTIEFLSKDVVRKYKGEMNFIHRVKICVMIECFEKYKSNILYLDSDTYFTASPLPLLEKIKQGTSIMNSNDYDLLSADELFENADWLLIRRTINKYAYMVENKEIKIPLTTRMWNAGVIGLSWEDGELLEPVLNLADQIYRNKKVFTAEQFAFSYFLQNKTDLISSGDIIFHYWRYFGKYKWRQQYTYHFKNFFKQHKRKSLKEQSELAFQLTLRHDELRLPPPTVFKKIMKRLGLMVEAGLKGKIKNPG